MIIENIQHWLCTEVILQQSMIFSLYPHPHPLLPPHPLPSFPVPLVLCSDEFKLISIFCNISYITHVMAGTGSDISIPSTIPPSAYRCTLTRDASILHDTSLEALLDQMTSPENYIHENVNLEGTFHAMALAHERSTGNLVGAAMLEWNDVTGYWQIWDVFVQKNHRRRGICRTLMTLLLGEAKSSDAGTLGDPHTPTHPPARTHPHAPTPTPVHPHGHPHAHAPVSLTVERGSAIVGGYVSLGFKIVEPSPNTHVYEMRWWREPTPPRTPLASPAPRSVE
jgi:hypothetical protein